jgi:COMPASS component SWD1
MQVVHRFQDLVNRTPWNGIGFSGDGEYVYAGAAHKAAHNVYVWDRGAGALDKILEGPKEPLVDADWHPTRPLLLSVSLSGSINIWFTPNAENWSAYAPGFEELEENIVYQEGEEEFDLEDEDEVSRRKRDEEEVDVDVLSVGPLPGASGVRPAEQITHPKAAGLDPRPSPDEEGKEWGYEWEDDPERLQEDFALYVNLEEEDLDEDALGDMDGH